MGRILAIIGGGGKTTSMCAISRHLEQSAVLMTTTTHILPVAPPESRVLLFDPDEQQLREALSQPGIVCAGVLEEKNGVSRFCSLDPELLKRAGEFADWVVCEADGANRRPLKLHKETEPVIPRNTDRCLIVLGLSALGKPVSQAVHRYDRNPLWAANPGMPVTPEVLFSCILENIAVTGLPNEKLYVLLNQADTLDDPKVAEGLVREVEKTGISCMAGSMRDDPLPILNWFLKP